MRQPASLSPDKASMDLASFCVPGSSAVIRSGRGWTKSNPGSCDPRWFVGDSTLILGDDSPDSGDGFSGATAAQWVITIDPSLISQMVGGHLIIACERIHGGLHTASYGATASVKLNQQNRDLICLKDIPAGHTDYFHRVPQPPGVPNVIPLSGCSTLYSWPVHPQHLEASGRQIIEAELDQDVSWDIDFVALLVLLKKNADDIRWLNSLLDDLAQRALAKGNALTEREREVFYVLATTESDREVRDALKIQQDTLRNHARSIIQKTNLPLKGPSGVRTYSRGFKDSRIGYKI